MDPAYNAIPDALDNLDLLSKGESKIISAKPLSQSIEAKNMATLLNEFVGKAHTVLNSLPYNQERTAAGLPAVNGIMPRGAGETPSLPTFRTKWGLKGGCVAGTGLVKGIARLTGMVVPDIPGATGYIDTDYLAKAKATCELLDQDLDFVLVHVEGIDEVSHDMNSTAKVKAIEDSSEILLKYLQEHLPDDVILCVLSDHTTSSTTGDHTIDPTGVVFWSREPSFRTDHVQQFTEKEMAQGALNQVAGKDIMPLLMGFAQRIKKFGA
jgi:2,3-bisphosphoglycerate-independent phosphoglycerate mutase